MNRDLARIEAKLDLTLRLQVKLYRKAVAIMAALDDLKSVVVEVKNAADALIAAHASAPVGVPEADVAAVAVDLASVASAMRAAVPAPDAPAAEVPVDATEVPAAPSA